VLLVANHEAQRDELRKLLESAGYKVILPPNLDEAVNAIQVADLFVMKVETAGVHEFAILNQIHEFETAWHVPVIVIVDKADAAAGIRCIELGAEDYLAWPVNSQGLLARAQAGIQRKQLWDRELEANDLVFRQKQEAEQLNSSLIALGARMIGESDPLKLLETILIESMRLTDCEGGTIYSRTADDRLKFVLVRNDMMDINMGGSTGRPITFEPLRLFEANGLPINKYVACHTVHTGQTVNVEDAYVPGRFDFAGTREFDARTGYRSKSFMTVPLKNERQKVIGALQLINARDRRTGQVQAFDSSLQSTIEAFAIMAAAVLEAYREQAR
jgi:CheY-like chemotaxis protein